jgi:hypothetical protein
MPTRRIVPGAEVSHSLGALAPQPPGAHPYLRFLVDDFALGVRFLHRPADPSFAAVLAASRTDPHSLRLGMEGPGPRTGSSSGAPAPKAQPFSGITIQSTR